MKIPHNKVFNLFASTVFGVFLIHANSDAMRFLLWKDTFQNLHWFLNTPSWLFLLVFLGSSFLVFVICALIDLVRKKYIEKPLFARLDRRIPKLDLWFPSSQHTHTYQSNISDENPYR